LKSNQLAARTRPPLVGTQPRRRLASLYLSSRRQQARWRDRFDQVERYCMFLGYPRSGHSLVGSLLDAHPDVVIAHGLDALRLLRLGFGQDQLYTLILANDRSFTAFGRRWTGSDYTVPGAWQGRFRRLRVISDKKGGQSTRRLGERPALLQRLRRTVGVPLRAVHVVRCPFDNIASMQLRRPATLEQVVEEYFGLCETMAELCRRLDTDELAEVRYEDLVADPASSLRSLAGFLGVGGDEAWVAAAAAVVDDRPSRSRTRVTWPPELVAGVERRIGRYDFLAGYGFET
jgi:hypothetical protein